MPSIWHHVERYSVNERKNTKMLPFKLCPPHVAIAVAFFIVANINWMESMTIDGNDLRIPIEKYEYEFEQYDIEQNDNSGASNEQSRNAVKSKQQRWPSHTIIYKISESYNDMEARNVQEALQQLEERTCLRFNEYDDPNKARSGYIYYEKSDKYCGTRVGYNQLTSGAGHRVFLKERCIQKPHIIMHETLHVLGLYHEQSRPDRDAYVKIDYNNMESKYKSQFSKKSTLYITTYNVPYDYNSIMHYNERAFAKDVSKPTIYAMNGTQVYERKMGETTEPSNGDIEKINIMYNCN